MVQGWGLVFVTFVIFDVISKSEIRSTSAFDQTLRQKAHLFIIKYMYSVFMKTAIVESNYIFIHVILPGKLQNRKIREA